MNMLELMRMDIGLRVGVAGLFAGVENSESDQWGYGAPSGYGVWTQVSCCIRSHLKTAVQIEDRQPDP